MTIATTAELIRVHGAERADHPAILFEGRTLTYGELHERSNRLANALAGAGVGKGERVAILDKNGPEFFELLCALAKLNAIIVPVNWRLAPVEISQIVADSGAIVMLVGPDFVDQLAAATSIASVATFVAVGAPAGDLPAGWHRYEEFLADGSVDDPGARPRASDVTMLQYTSGTTGLPKGVMTTHANIYDGVAKATPSWHLTSDSVNLIVMPLFHIAGSGTAIVGMFHGATMVLARDVVPSEILRLIPRYRVTNTLFVPAVIQFLLMEPGIDSVDLSTFRSVVYGASPITDAVLTRAMEVFGCDFVQLYGLTETTGGITQLDAADHDPVNRPDLLRSCGRPFPWVEIRIVDRDTGADVADGVVGELWTRSSHNMAGYWANDAATRAAVTDDGWFKTGDAGYRDADGFVFLHDRVKDMIVSGGENVYPAEVENVLMRHPGVADVAVVGVPDERWGEAVKAVVVVAAGASVTADELVEFARGHLGGYKLPKSVDFADALPRNPSGKLLKRVIRAPYWEGHDRQI